MYHTVYTEVKRLHCIRRSDIREALDTICGYQVPFRARQIYRHSTWDADHAQRCASKYDTSGDELGDNEVCQLFHTSCNTPVHPFFHAHLIHNLPSIVCATVSSIFLQNSRQSRAPWSYAWSATGAVSTKASSPAVKNMTCSQPLLAVMSITLDVSLRSRVAKYPLLYKKAMFADVVSTVRSSCEWIYVQQRLGKLSFGIFVVEKKSWNRCLMIWRCSFLRTMTRNTYFFYIRNGCALLLSGFY
jgi:hypothetical protein